ncbi:hypothetical protein P8C59_006060 [Phyllachora maydis]|uniref:Uncharacterized protein n=1 Tax=Phyllachora maydis TaxID=1825666 RepID=A0AAD9MC50_9PEZI|nr:hypothetical protein P8C59_006060 [Phyllachora maydis]
MNRPEDTALAKHDIVVEGGFLTLTAGSAAWKPGKGAVIAGALNTGVINMTQGLGAAPRDKRIRVNTVVTGSVITEHRDSVFDKLGLNKEEQDAWFEKTVAEPHP